MAKIAAVISTFNRGEKIISTINSLISQTLALDKIVVVDDGSDNDKRVPQFTNKKVVVKYFKKNVGAVWGRNYGLSLLDNYDYVLIIDDDVELDRDALKFLLGAFKDNDDCVASMPVVFFKSQPKKVWSSGSGVNLFSGQTIFYTDVPKTVYRKIPAATSVLLVDMKKLKNSGWYDPIYYFCYEDADFYYRLADHNKGSIYVVKNAKAYHDIGAGSSLEKVAKRSYHIGRGRVIFLSRFSRYFPLNISIVVFFSLYYFYLGLKYSDPLSGFRFFQGIKDGVSYILGGDLKSKSDIMYTNKLDPERFVEPAFIKKYRVK